MKPYRLYIAYVSWGGEGKPRPVLIMSVRGENAFVYSITTQYENKSPAVQAHYFKIARWAKAGLEKQSYVDTTVRFSIPLEKLKDKLFIGKLSSSDKENLSRFLAKKER